MQLNDWIGLLSVGGIWAGSLGGVMLYLHSRNVKAKDEDREEHEKRARIVDRQFDDLKGTLQKFDRDMDGLTQQMVANQSDMSARFLQVEQRFLPRAEHADTISALRAEIRDLTQALGNFSSRLFDIARNGRQG